MILHYFEKVTSEVGGGYSDLGDIFLMKVRGREDGTNHWLRRVGQWGAVPVGWLVKPVLQFLLRRSVCALQSQHRHFVKRNTECCVTDIFRFAFLHRGRERVDPAQYVLQQLNRLTGRVVVIFHRHEMFSSQTNLNLVRISSDQWISSTCVT